MRDGHATDGAARHPNHPNGPAREGMWGTRPHDLWSTVLLVTGLFASVTALSYLYADAGEEGISLLYTLPIALLAVRAGLRGGVAGAAAGLGLFSIWAVLAGAEVSVTRYMTQAFAFLVVGGLPGILADQQSRMRAADRTWFEMSNDMLVEANLNGYFTRLSDRWEACLGWTREELMSRPFVDFVHPDDRAATVGVASSLDERPGEIVDFENRYRAKDGSWRWLLWSARSDEHRKYAIARDITERKQLDHEREERLGRVEAMARTDSLTGLPNRRSWDEELRHAIARSTRHGRPLALAMADLDHFKLFNDAHGHAAGDALLAEAAVRWRLTLRSTDFLARYGGEEFAVLLPDCTPAEVERLLDRLREATPPPQTCSIGVAYWVRADGPEALTARADAALYTAKRHGRDRVVTAG